MPQTAAPVPTDDTPPPTVDAPMPAGGNAADEFARDDHPTDGSAAEDAIGSPAPSREPLANAGETFDTAWRAVRDTHFDLQVLDVDWDAVRDELRPKAETATSQSELRAVIGEMLGRLGQSHFVVLPREIARDVAHTDETADAARPGNDRPRGRGEVGLRFRLLDNALIVSAVDPGSPAADAGVQPGWALDAVNGEPIAPRIERLLDILDGPDAAGQAAAVGRHLTRGGVGTTVELKFLRNGETVTHELLRVRPDEEMFQLGNLPPMPVEFEAREMTTDAGQRIGYIRFSVWMLPVAGQFHTAIDRFRDADGIIIDLRGNPGGVAGMIMGIGGHFFLEQTSLGTFRNPGAEIEFLANPRFSSATGEPVDPYTGPLAILVDGMSGSTSEIFAGGMQATERAMIFGETSMGAALPAMLTELPNGDMLMHAIADFISPDGTRLEGRGVIPNKPITPTRDDLRAGRDVVVEAALAWFAEQATSAAPTVEK